jgi:hypothetical protein
LLTVTRGALSVIARSPCDEAIQFFICGFWIASLSSGAHSRDPLARNDDYAAKNAKKPNTTVDNVTTPV